MGKIELYANSILRQRYVFGRFCFFCVCVWGGGAVAQSVERATPGEEVPGSFPAVAAVSLLVGSVSV